MNLYNLSFVKSPSHYSVISDLSASFVRFLTHTLHLKVPQYFYNFNSNILINYILISHVMLYWQILLPYAFL